MAAMPARSCGRRCARSAPGPSRSQALGPGPRLRASPPPLGGRAHLRLARSQSPPRQGLRSQHPQLRMLALPRRRQALDARIIGISSLNRIMSRVLSNWSRCANSIGQDLLRVIRESPQKELAADVSTSTASRTHSTTTPVIRTLPNTTFVRSAPAR